MFKRLAEQLNLKKVENSSFPMSSPAQEFKEYAKKTFLKSMSKHALNLYERKTDINNFTKLVLSDPENTSHNKLVEELLASEDFVNPYDESALFELSENERFLEDLGFEK